MPGAGERYCLFGTAFGRVGIGWNEAGVRRVHLPEIDVATLRTWMERHGAVEGVPSPTVETAIDRLRAYFNGVETDFADLEVALPEMTSGERRRIYAATRALKWGETASYGEIAGRAGLPGGARAVGQAMPIIIPCHRVLAAGDRLGGFSAYGGVLTKEKLLVLEKARLL